VICAVLLVVNYISGVPPEIVNFEGVFLDDRPQLIEPGSLVMMSRLVKIRVGTEQQCE